jgi:hypothetical protein
MTRVGVTTRAVMTRAGVTTRAGDNNKGGQRQQRWVAMMRAGGDDEGRQ